VRGTSSGLPRAVWLAVAVGVLLRLVFAFGYWTAQPLTHDEREYLLLARSLATGRGFTYSALDGAPLPGEHYGRAPIYPALLAGVIRATPNALAGAGDGPTDLPVSRRVIHTIRGIQAGLGGLVVLLVGAIARRAAGRRAAAVAAVIAAVFPPFIWTPAFVFSETLFMVVALSAALALTPRHRDGVAPPLVPGAAAAVGLLLGVGILVRPAMLFFVAVLGPWLFAVRRQRLAAVLLVVCAGCAVIPWSVRNTMAYGRFVAVASEGGITFWTGNHPLAIGDGDLAANPDMKRSNVAFRERHPGLSPEALEPLYYRESLDWIRDHPLDWLALTARKAFYSVVPIGPSYRLHSARYFWASVLPYLAVLALAIMGGFAIARQGRLPAAVLLLAASTLLMGLVFFPQERFRIPALDPALIVLASGVCLRLPGADD
jgi:4-amino-4-deoxy-L-arabinose transferase-like glycosyltransferase